MAATYHAGYGWPVNDEPRETIAAVVLAAGAGRRFGGPKQLHLIDGTTMLERVLTAVERSGITTRLVVLGARAEQITAEVPLHGAIAVVSPRWADGQAASLRTALGALPEAIDEALVVLGDGPMLDPRAIRRIAAAGRGVRAADYGRGRSHPVDQPLRHRIAAADRLHGVAQLGLEVVALAAVGAGAEVLLDHRNLIRRQLPVEVGLQLALDAQTWIKAHDASSDALLANACLRARRPRCNRDMTVPIGMPRMSAASW